MAVSAGAVFVDLGARLDRREFEAYDKQLKKVQAQAARREHFKVQLGADYNAKAFRAYEGDLRRAERANDNMVRSNARLRTAFGSVWSKGGAAFAAVGASVGLVTAVKSVSSAYAESQVSQQKMATQLKALGVSYDAHAKQIDQVIQKTSQLSGLDDEDLQDAFTNIVRVTGKVNESLKLTGLAADFARAKHLDVAKAGEIVAKVAGGNTGILSRYGIQIQKGATASEALGKLQEKFSGQAAAYGKTQAGAADRAKVAFENLQETLGRRLSPVLTKVFNGVAKFVDQLSTGTGAVGRFERGVRAAVSSVQQAVGRWVDRNRDDINSVIAAFRNIGRAVRAVVEDVILPVIRRMIPGVRTALEGVVEVVRGLVRVISGILTGDFGKAWDGVKDIFKGAITKALPGVLRAGTAPTRAAAAAIGRGIARAFSGAWDGIKSTATGFINDLIDIVNWPLGKLGITKIGHIGGGGSSSSGNPNTTASKKAAGGWIGARGMAGADTVPALLGDGEAVLNRHQQAVIEGLLGDGFLDHLFANVQRPHYLARGGRARFATGGGTGNAWGQHLSKSQLEALWKQAGGDSGQANLMAAIALAESGGWTRRPNATGSGAFGLWQILGSVVPGDLGDPLVNARNAVRKLATQGLGAWEAYTNGSYKQYLGGGGGGIGGFLKGAIGAVKDVVTAPISLLLSHLHLPSIPGAAGPFGGVLKAVGGKILDAVKAKIGLGGDGGGSPGPASGPAGTTVFKGIQMAQWVAAALRYAQTKGVESQPTSGYRPGFDPHTSSGRSEHQGTQYPHGAVDFGSYTTGLGPKMAVVNATRDFKWPLLAPIGFRDDGHASGTGHARGGRIRRFAKGGKVSKLAKIVGGASAGLIRKITPLQSDRSDLFDTAMANVEDLDKEYGRWERRYNVTDEELVDADTGQVNVAAVQRKAQHLAKLIFIRNEMIHQLELARETVKRIIESYQNVLHALRNSLRHAKRKDRKGIQGYIDQYEGRVDEWKGKLGEVGDTLFDTRTDMLEVSGELKDVLATKGTPSEPVDTGGTDLAPDLGGADTTTPGDTPPADATPAPPSAADIAAAAAQELGNYFSAQRDLFSTFAGNAIGARQAFASGGIFSGAPNLEGGALGGLRAFGAGGSLAGSLGAGHGGPIIVVNDGGAGVQANFAAAPDNGATLLEQLRWQVENGVGG